MRVVFTIRECDGNLKQRRHGGKDQKMVEAVGIEPTCPKAAHTASTCLVLFFNLALSCPNGQGKVRTSLTVSQPADRHRRLPAH